MTPRLLLALTLFTVPAGAREGREGNALFAEERFEEAAARYRAGLDRNTEAAGAVRAGLFNNLGAALYRQEQYAEAQAAFEAALAAALAPEDRARAAYHAGNAAAQQQNVEAALGFYRAALLAQPDHFEAKFNYEYLRRQLQEDRPQPPDQPPPEPSDYARQLKEEADRLVAQRRYADALTLLQNGLRTDSTVQAYSDFIGRLGTVVQIEDGGARLDL